MMGELPDIKAPPDRFEQAWAKICEHFPQALLIVRDDSRSMLRWRSTDPTWAVGACSRFERGLMDDDFLDREATYRRLEDA